MPQELESVLYAPQPPCQNCETARKNTLKRQISSRGCCQRWAIWCNLPQKTSVSSGQTTICTRKRRVIGSMARGAESPPRTKTLQAPFLEGASVAVLGAIAVCLATSAKWSGHFSMTLADLIVTAETGTFCIGSPGRSPLSLVVVFTLEIESTTPKPLTTRPKTA